MTKRKPESAPHPARGFTARQPLPASGARDKKKRRAKPIKKPVNTASPTDRGTLGGGFPMRGGER